MSRADDPPEDAWSRERLENAIVGRAPTTVLKWIARFAADTRPLGPEPGWFFDRSEMSDAPDIRFRRKIWREFERRRLTETRA